MDRSPLIPERKISGFLRSWIEADVGTAGRRRKALISDSPSASGRRRSCSSVARSRRPARTIADTCCAAEGARKPMLSTSLAPLDVGAFRGHSAGVSISRDSFRPHLPIAGSRSAIRRRNRLLPEPDAPVVASRAGRSTSQAAQVHGGSCVSRMDSSYRTSTRHARHGRRN